MNRVLLHSCCAPCSVYCIDALRREGIEPVSLWYNPNIHPYQEYKMRRDTLIDYGKRVDMDVRVLENYGLREFVKNVADKIENRCETCYTMRLRVAAQYAAEHGFDAFTSSLFVSPYQNHDLMKEIAERAASQFGITFLYRDFRVGFREGQAKARESGLYMQKYCGCIFSEEDRYAKQIAKDKEAFSANKVLG